MLGGEHFGEQIIVLSVRDELAIRGRHDLSCGKNVASIENTETKTRTGSLAAH